MNETEHKLGQNGNQKTLHGGCHGCFNQDTCGGKIATDLLVPNMKRLPNVGKRFECHSLIADFPSRPPDPKETRRQFGETAVQY